MKANELMIGDWVKFPIGNEKIIDLPYIPGKGICASFAASATLFPVEVEKLAPIPLTPEILEKNGFECRGAWYLPGEDLGLRQDGDSWGLLSYYAEYDTLAFCHIKYVHQLQHALQLCDIEKEIKL